MGAELSAARPLSRSETPLSAGGDGGGGGDASSQSHRHHHPPHCPPGGAAIGPSDVGAASLALLLSASEIVGLEAGGHCNVM